MSSKCLSNTASSLDLLHLGAGEGALANPAVNQHARVFDLISTHDLPYRARVRRDAAAGRDVPQLRGRWRGAGGKRGAGGLACSMPFSRGQRAPLESLTLGISRWL